jgi:hypothetical protein
MNISVILFGMPRFFKHTFPVFHKHFSSLKAVNVKYSGYLWDRIGYVPECDTKFKVGVVPREDFYKFTKKHLGSNNIHLADYRELKFYCNNFPNIFSFKEGEVNHPYYKQFFCTERIEHWYYEIGQIYSSAKAACAAIEHEERDSDMYILTRTDMFLAPPALRDIQSFYNNVSTFLKRKTKPCMLVSGLEGHMTDTKEINYYPCHLKYTPNERPKFNDWFIICNKEALIKIFCNRISNYIYSICHDVVQCFEGNRNFFLTDSPQYTLGKLCALNNIELYNMHYFSTFGYPVTKVIHKDPIYHKKSDSLSKVRIINDKYDKMIEQYKKIYKL